MHVLGPKRGFRYGPGKIGRGVQFLQVQKSMVKCVDHVAVKHVDVIEKGEWARFLQEIPTARKNGVALNLSWFFKKWFWDHFARGYFLPIDFDISKCALENIWIL